MAFALGWSPDHARRAGERLDTSGRYCTVAPPTKPPRPAVSLSKYRLNYYSQLDQGTCYAHSPKQMAEVIARVKGYPAFPISRRLIAWQASQMGGGHNPADGGSPTDAIISMTSEGVGVAREDLWPYVNSRNALAQKPPDSVFQDATKTHLVAPVRVRVEGDTDEIVRMIDAGFPVANGFPAPVSLQKQGATFIDSIRGIIGGHSILFWGYIEKGVIDAYRWLEAEGWWNLMYRPLPPEIAALVDGYVPVSPDRTSSVLMRDDVYLQLCSMDPYAEHVTATDMDGLTQGDVIPGPSFREAFPI